MFSLRIWKQPNSGDRYLVDTARSRYGMDPQGVCWGLIPGLHGPRLQPDDVLPVLREAS